MSIHSFIEQHWQSIAVLQEIDANRWNGLKEDVRSMITGLEDQHVANDAFNLTSLRGRGIRLNATTTRSANSTAVVIGRSTHFVGKWTENKATEYSPTTSYYTVTASANSLISLTGKGNHLKIYNACAVNTPGIVAGFTNGVAGQVIRLCLSPAGTGSTTIWQNRGSSGNQFYLAGAANVNYDHATATKPLVITFIKLDPGGAFGTTEWLEIGRADHR